MQVHKGAVTLNPVFRYARWLPLTGPLFDAPWQGR